MELVAPRFPVGTGPLHFCESILGFDFGLAFQELDAKTSCNMEGNVAVHEPGTRVVGLEGERDPPPGGQHGDVAALRVAEVEGSKVARKVERVVGVELVAGDAGRVGGQGRAADDEEIVAVEVDRVGG